MNPKTILATCTVLLVSLVGSATPVAQRTPELTPDQLHAWRLHDQYVGVIAQLDGLEVQRRTLSSDFKHDSKALDPSTAIGYGRDMKLLNQRIAEVSKKAADLEAAWERKFGGRFGPLKDAREFIIDPSTKKKMDKISFRLTNFAFDPDKPQPATATTSVLGIYEGSLSLTYANKEEYANKGLMPGTDESTLEMNEFKKAGNVAWLKMLENLFSQKAAAKVKLEIVFNSDQETRAKSGAQPDVMVSGGNGFVAQVVVGRSQYISSQALGITGGSGTLDTKSITKCDVTGNAVEIVKSEQIGESGGIVKYVYTVKASVSGNKLTGTWVTTRNGKELFKGVLTADRIASVGEDGSIRIIN